MQKGAAGLNRKDLPIVRDRCVIFVLMLIYTAHTWQGVVKYFFTLLWKDSLQ